MLLLLCCSTAGDPIWSLKSVCLARSVTKRSEQSSVNLLGRHKQPLARTRTEKKLNASNLLLKDFSTLECSITLVLACDLVFRRPFVEI